MSAARRDEAGAALTRGSFQLLAGRVFFLFAGFAIAAILSRALGPIEFGVYGVVISVLTWCQQLLSAGVPGATAVLIPRHDDRRRNVENSARILLLVWSMPLFAGLWFAAPSLADYFGIANGTTLIRLASVNLPTMTLFFALEGILNGRRKFKAQSALQIIQSGTKLLGVLVLLAIGVTVSGVLVAHLAATLATVLIISFIFPPALTLPSKAILKSMLRLALPGGIYMIAFSALANFSLWQLKGSPAGAGEAIGYFVATLNLTRILQMVPAALSGVLFATLAWATANANRPLAQQYVNEASRLSLGVLVPACILLSVHASDLMAIVFGPEYAAGGDILIVLSLAFACSALLDLWLSALSADGAFTVPAIIVVSLLPVLYVGNLMLIPWGGAIGAALASVIVLAIGAAIAGVLTWRKYRALAQTATLARIGLAGSVIWVLGSLIPASGPWVVVVLAALGFLYLAILWATGELTKQDLAALPFMRTAES